MVDDSWLAMWEDVQVLWLVEARRSVGPKPPQTITASLRAIDPVDPVRFDFSLCHGEIGRAHV